jgi:hypothetical protein
MEIPANPLRLRRTRFIEWVRIEIGKISNAVKVFIQKRRRTRNRDNTFVMNSSPVFRVEMRDDSIEWVGRSKRECNARSQVNEFDEDKDND